MGNIHDSNKMSAVPWTEHCTSNEKWVFYGIIKIKQFRASSGTVPLRTSSVNFHSSVNRFFLQMVENWERILQHFFLLLLVVLSIISRLRSPLFKLNYSTLDRRLLNNFFFFSFSFLVHTILRTGFGIWPGLKLLSLRTACYQAFELYLNYNWIIYKMFLKIVWRFTYTIHALHQLQESLKNIYYIL